LTIDGQHLVQQLPVLSLLQLLMRTRTLKQILRYYIKFRHDLSLGLMRENISLI